MDSALLMVSAETECPQPSTKMHVKAIELRGLDEIIVVQNKVDLAMRVNGQIEENYEQIRGFLKKTKWNGCPVIPTSAYYGYNIDAVLESIVNVKIPKRSLKLPLRMTIVRSFDVNKPGTSFEKLQGGVIGGTISQGMLHLGMEIEILPGIIYANKKYKPIKTKVVSLRAE